MAALLSDVVRSEGLVDLPIAVRSTPCPLAPGCSESLGASCPNVRRSPGLRAVGIGASSLAKVCVPAVSTAMTPPRSGRRPATDERSACAVVRGRDHLDGIADA